MSRLSNDIINNILCAYGVCPPELREQGRWWYHEAREELIRRIARPHNLSCDSVCAATAALSPGRSWTRNVQDVIGLIGGNTRVGSYGESNVQKALLCLTGASPLAVLSGPKVTAFYLCLTTGGKHPRAITLDRHMKRIACMSALGDKDSIIRTYEYDWYARHFRVASHILRLRPACLQAALWLDWLSRGPELIVAVRGMEDIAA